MNKYISLFFFLTIYSIVGYGQELDTNNVKFAVVDSTYSTGFLGSGFSKASVKIIVKKKRGKNQQFTFFQVVNREEGTSYRVINEKGLSFPFNLKESSGNGGFFWVENNDETKYHHIQHRFASSKNKFLLETFVVWFQLNESYLPSGKERFVIAKRGFHLNNKKFKPSDKIKAIMFKKDTIFRDAIFYGTNDTALVFKANKYVIYGEKKDSISVIPSRYLYIPANKIALAVFSPQQKAKNNTYGIIGGVATLTSPITFLTGAIITTSKAVKKKPLKSGLIVMGVGVVQFVTGFIVGTKNSNDKTYLKSKYEFKKKN